MDEQGEEVDGDRIMAICARALKRNGCLAHDTVAATVMSNLGLEKSLAEAGIRLVRTAVGDRYVVECMRANGYNFGGEQSGHLIFLDHATTGDGTLAALQLLAVMAEEGKPLSELASVMTPFPQVLENLQGPLPRAAGGPAPRAGRHPRGGGRTGEGRPGPRALLGNRGETARDGGGGE